MLPLAFLLVQAGIILVTGVIVYNTSIFPKVHPVLFAWLWFNIFIAIYEFYIIYNRQYFVSLSCPNDFWKEQVNNNFWLKAWHEYTCYSDMRYLDPKDTVFFIEGLNGILVLLQWVAFLTKSYNILIYLLILQAANCLFYFVSLYNSRKMNISLPYKASSYLIISSLWFIMPLYIVLFIPCA